MNRTMPTSSRTLDVFLAVENLLVMLVALLGNLIMCVAGIRLMRRKFASNVLIFSLVLHSNRPDQEILVPDWLITGHVT